eukprot:1149402-Rhodomonas_salina.3
MKGCHAFLNLKTDRKGGFVASRIRPGWSWVAAEERLCVGFAGMQVCPSVGCNVSSGVWKATCACEGGVQCALWRVWNGAMLGRMAFWSVVDLFLDGMLRALCLPCSACWCV